MPAIEEDTLERAAYDPIVTESEEPTSPAYMFNNRNLNMYSMLNNHMKQIIVENINANLTQFDLGLVFSEFGVLWKCCIIDGYRVVDTVTEPHRYGIVVFRRGVDAKQAVQSLNFVSLLGRRLRMFRMLSESQRQHGDETTLYVSHLPNDFSSADMVAAFHGFGAIVDHRLLALTKTGRCMKRGIITFLRKKAATEAIRAMDGKRMAHYDQPLGVQLSESQIYKDNATDIERMLNATQSYTEPVYPPYQQPPPPPPPQIEPLLHRATVYVTRLPHDVQDDQLWSLFREVGPVTKVNVVRMNRRNVCDGYAFVVMRDEYFARLAAATLDNTYFGNKLIKAKCLHNE